MISTVLFDFDGTLVNTNEVIIQSWQHTYRHYLGHEVAVEHITTCFGEPLLITMAREFPAVPPEEAAEEYRRWQVEHADELVEIFPGIVEMLKALKTEGYKLGIVTSRTRDSALRYMDKFQIASYFDDLVTCDDTTAHKPNPEPILLGLSHLHVGKEEAIMVGDSAFDIKCANNAGVQSVLVDWRVTGEGSDLVADARQDYVIETPAQLPELLQTLR